MFHRHFAMAGAAALMLATTAFAQGVSIYRSESGGRAFTLSTSEDRNRAVIGITTSVGSMRDTLGVLIGSVSVGGPAEKAGIEEGNRIQSINGVNLKLAPEDAGEWDMSGIMTRRFTREMAKVKAGDEVELRVYTGAGRTRSVKVKTVTYEDLYETGRRTTLRESDDRPVLGVSLGSSGSKRDTLGVLLIGIDDDGPAGKAGLEEGNRIQTINGVDLRVAREDAGDSFLSGSMVRRLQREMEKVKVGDEVSLRVYVGGGRTRDVRIKAVPQSDLRRRGMSIFGTTPMAMPFGIEMRRDLEDRIGRSLEPMRRLEGLQELAPAVRAAVRTRVIL